MMNLKAMMKQPVMGKPSNLGAFKPDNPPTPGLLKKKKPFGNMGGPPSPGKGLAAKLTGGY